MTFVLRMMGCIVLAFALAACHAPNAGADKVSTMQLKLYRVPADQSKAIAKDLGAVLESSEFQLGTKAHTEMRVTQPFPGTVMVLAPAALQSSIASAIDEMAKSAGKQQAGGAPENVPLRVQFWVVQAKAGAGDDEAALQPLQDTLKQMRGSLGPSHFVLEDTASALVDAPDHSGIAGGNGNIVTARAHQFGFHAAAVSDGKVGLEVNYMDAAKDVADRSIPVLHTTITIDPGNYVVLAEAPPATGNAGKPDTTLMNLLVVRVDRIKPTPR